ncbi:hypothetical protein J0H33_03360 [bacterium]|nr:hypothetical protein [bacterium]
MMKLKTLATGLFAIIAIAVAVAAGAGATTASFSDQVTSGGNTFKAGTLQLNLNPAVASCAPPARTYGGVTGNAGVDGNTGCSVTNGATYSPATTAMKPGDSSTATYGVTNIGTLSGTLSVGATSWSVTTAGKGACTVSASNFTISSSYSATSVGAGNTASVPVTGVVPTSSADGCQGATITASVPFQMNGASTTGFSDRLTSGGNVFTMTTLPAPVLGATLDTDTTKVDLTWTGSYGSFPGTTFTGARYSGGTCSGGATALNSGNAISSGYVDAPASAGQYSYIVTAHFATNWVAVSNCATATTSVPTQKLYINNTSGHAPQNLDSTLGAANYTDVAPTANQPGSPFVWPSSMQHTVNSNANWSIGLYVTGPSQFTSTSVPILVTVYLSSSASCSTVTTTIATGTDSVFPTAQPYTAPALALTPAPGFTAGTGYICLQLVNNAQDNGTSHHFWLTANLNSYLAGVFS